MLRECPDLPLFSGAPSGTRNVQKSSTEIGEWPPLSVMHRGTEDGTEHNGVVTGGQQLFGPALQPGQGAMDQRRTGDLGHLVVDSLELSPAVPARIGEVPRHRALTCRQH